MNRNISIHALLAESDGLGFCYHCDDVAFLSTLSLRRATAPNRRPCRCNKISIHALLAESDLFFIVFDLFRNISIHALLAESDSPLSINCMIHMQFLSTLSLRRATMQIVIIVVDTVISIHALLAESDIFLFARLSAVRDFYPRSPCGERPRNGAIRVHLDNISIHALLAESDGHFADRYRQLHHFYPRSPCGERHPKINVRYGDLNFYPRSPCGERLSACSRGCSLRCISIHALLAESDGCRLLPEWGHWDFYPRSPCGERPEHGQSRYQHQQPFLSTLSLRRATGNGADHRSHLRISIHALLAESDRYPGGIPRQHVISIHALLAESDHCILFW